MTGFRPLLLSTLALAICLLSTACVSSRPVHYYTLNVPAMDTAASKPDGPVLLVGRIATTEALQDGRIRYRSGNNEVGAYEYHRWTERPGMMVRDLLLDDLRASGKFRQVLEASTEAGGDFLVRGKLDEFSEIDEPGIQTKVSLYVELVDRKDSKVVWEHHFTHNEPVAGKAMKDVVGSLDHNLQQVVNEAAAGIESFLSGRR